MCCGQIAHATVRKLTDIKGISEQKAMKLKEIAYKLVPMGFVTVSEQSRAGSLAECGPFSDGGVYACCGCGVQAAQTLVDRQDLITLSTGSKTLNDLLGGARRSSSADDMG